MNHEDIAETIVDRVLDSCESYNILPNTYLQLIKEVNNFIKEETGILSWKNIIF